MLVGQVVTPPLHPVSSPLHALTTITKHTLTIAPAYTKKFSLRNNTLTCLNCLHIQADRIPWVLDLVKADPNNPLSQLVQKWVLHPHQCILSNLKTIQLMHSTHVIQSHLFDEWMSLNGGDYQLGVSPACRTLWDSFLDYRFVRSKPKHLERALQAKRLGAFHLERCSKHGGYWVVIHWRAIKSKGDLEGLNEVWKWSSPADHGKSSISAADLIWHMARYKDLQARYDKWCRLFSASLFNVTVSAMLIHIIGNEHAHCVFDLLLQQKACCMDMEDYVALLKALSVALRRTGVWPDGTPATLEERTGCAGWELAIGRSGNQSDWAEEKRKRTEVVVNLGAPVYQQKTDETNASYCASLRRHIDTIMGQLVKRPPRPESWADFVSARQRWVSSGSTGGAKLSLPDGSRLRMNKQAYFDSVSKEDMIGWMELEPKMQATASEKFEMGKARAIYGTGVNDYAISCYALDGIEDYLYNADGIESGLLGRDALATIIRRVQNASTPGTECTMVDYTDFNYQHTLMAQSLVFQSLADALERRNYHPDKVRAARWIAAALLNQHCKFPQDRGISTPVVQGMFSGCRGTNFKNTVLNCAYFMNAREWVEVNLGLSAVDLVHIHQGDDVWISNKSRLWAIALYNTCASSGLEFQPSKQLFDVGLGEFLRVVYTGGSCRGYVARAIATTIMKPIQGADIVSPAERAIALNGQIMTLVRRGFSQEGAKVLWAALVPYAARAKLVSGALTIPVGYLNLSFVDNGLDLGPPFTAAHPANTVTPIPTMALESVELERAVPKMMASDYVDAIGEKIQRPFRRDELVERIHASNVVGSYRASDKVLCLREHEKDLRKWLSKLKLPPVRRDRAAYDAKFVGPTGGYPVEDNLRQLAEDWLPKITAQRRTQLGVIMAALGSSPFRSLANAKTATGLDDIDAAFIAFSECPNMATASKAANLLNALVTRCGAPVAKAILGELRAGAGIYEGRYHPCLLSWVQDQALDELILEVTNKRITDVATVKSMFPRIMDGYIRSLEKWPIFRTISQY